MENIFVKNRDELEKKIKKFIADGANKLHVVSDFDRTLTPAFINGVRATTSFAQARRGGYLGGEYTEKAQKLFDHYRPIEVSALIPLDEKKKGMQKWWEEHLDLLVNYGMRKDVIDEIVNSGRVKLRVGVTDFLDALNKFSVPILIFSAGLGDIINEYFYLIGKFGPNVHIVSNFFVFDAEGLAVSYTTPVVHTYNKDEIEVKNEPYFKDLGQRKNIILLGNDAGDLGMSDGFNYNEIIRIGFLNKEEVENENEFKNKYDVVIEDDGGMEYVNELLGEILGNI